MIEKRIRELRKSQHMTQKQLAQKLYIDPSAVAYWESGKTKPSMENQIALAKIFGVTVDYLLGTENPDEPPMNPRDERDIQRRLKAALGDLEGETSALMFDGEPLDDETRELLIASLERTIRQAKIMAKGKYTPKKYRSNGSDAHEAHEANPEGDK